MSSIALERRAGRLPAELTSFVGRRAELAEIQLLLERSRLVTLMGPGGVGKTRLAIRAAGEVRQAFRDGVCFADLAALREPGLLAETLCDALGLPGQNADEPLDRLADYLADRQLLLVLDTCEHLVDACALLAEVLLRAAPRLRILATSRQSLDVSGESTLIVDPLGRPDLALPHAELGADPGCESVALFADRAMAVVPGWTITAANQAAVARLCHRLDGMPLAIELTVVQLRVLSVEQIAARLDDRILQIKGRRGGLARHQTLRAAIDWSHELCTPAERLLWARLSVLAGDFDLDSADRICTGEGLPTEDFIEVLSGLITKSIVYRSGRDDDSRYRMLDTIREYGVERLEERGETGVLRTRTLEWYAGLAQQARAELSTDAQQRWLDWFLREQANIRAVLDHGLRTADDDLVLRTSLSVGRMWALLGRMGEARHWAEKVLESRDTAGPEWTEMLTLTALLAALQTDLDRARELLAVAGPRAERLGEPRLVGYVREVQGLVAIYAGDLDSARRLLDEAGELHRSVGDHEIVAMIGDVLLAGACALGGDTTAAMDRASRAVGVSEERGELWCRSYALSVWGVASWMSGDPEAAMPRLRDGLRISRDLDDWLGMATALELIGGCLFALGEVERGARTLGAGDHARKSTGASLFGPNHVMLRGLYEQQGRTVLGDEDFGAAYGAGIALGADAVIANVLGEEPAQGGGASETEAPQPLTRREQEIAALVAQGLSNREIAERLVIAKRTVDSHLEHILAKLAFSSRAQIAAWVTKHASPQVVAGSSSAAGVSGGLPSSSRMPYRR